MGAAPLLRSFNVPHEHCEHGCSATYPKRRNTLLLLSQAVSTRSLRESKTHFRNFSYAFAAGLTSAINFLIEFYIVVRFITLQLPFFLIRRDRRVFADLRLLRALSLLVLDILTVYPSIRFVNIAADYIPSAIGMILVLLAFNHQSPRGYSISPSGRSTRSTNLDQPLASDGSTVQSWDHILPMHTPPSTFEVRSSEYGIRRDTSPGSVYLPPQAHPFGAIALSNQSVRQGSTYPLPVDPGTTDATCPGSPVVSPPPPAIPAIDYSQSPGIDNSPTPESCSNVDQASTVGTSGSTRRSFLPALPTMAWGTDAGTPLNIESVQPSPTTVTKGPILLEVASDMPRQESPGSTPLVMALASASSATTSPVPPGPSRPPQIAVPRKAMSLVIEGDGAPKDPGHDALTMPSSPISIMYGSDILSPSAGLVDVMKRDYSTSTRSKHLSHLTAGQRTSTSSWAGAWSTRVSATESMIQNYRFLAPPPSPGYGELSASPGTGSGGRQPGTADGASRKWESGGKRPNTFGKESFLDFKLPTIGSRPSSAKTKSSNRSSRSTDGLSRPHSETDESLRTGAGKREKGKGARKARRTPVGAGVIDKEQLQRSMDPAPPQMTGAEDAAS
jgi:hypothetical protein